MKTQKMRTLLENRLAYSEESGMPYIPLDRDEARVLIDALGALEDARLSSRQLAREVSELTEMLERGKG